MSEASERDELYDTLDLLGREQARLRLRVLILDRILLRVLMAYCAQASVMGGLDKAQQLRRDILNELTSGDIENKLARSVQDQAVSLASDFFQQLELAIKDVKRP